MFFKVSNYLWNYSTHNFDGVWLMRHIAFYDFRVALLLDSRYSAELYLLPFNTDFQACTFFWGGGKTLTNTVISR